MIDFEDAPSAFAVYGNKLLIASYSHFYVVQDFEKKLVFENVFWHSLYPGSVAVCNDENVFVGIYGGILKLDLTDKILRFYTPIR